MDITGFVPQIAALFHVAPSSLLLLIMAIGTAANATARLIPDDATGWAGDVRQVAAVVGVYVPNRLTAGVTVNDVAKASLTTPPITEKVAAAQAEPDILELTDEHALAVPAAEPNPAQDEPKEDDMNILERLEALEKAIPSIESTIARVAAVEDAVGIGGAKVKGLVDTAARDAQVAGEAAQALGA